MQFTQSTCSVEQEFNCIYLEQGLSQVKQIYLVHIHPFERCLQQFEIVNVLVLQFSLKLDLLKTDAAREEQIH